MSGECLDVSSVPFCVPGSTARAVPLPTQLPSGSTNARRFLGIHFACCEVYSRIYPNREATAYEGKCPRCAKPVRLVIGPGGTDSRFFTVH